jgi:threonine dehydratase
MTNYIDKIEHSSVYDVVLKTNLQKAEALTKRLNNNIFLKREDQQSVHSFKIRGAYNKIVNLNKNQLENGIIASSAGNHAQGVAFSASKLGINATIVMPKTTPAIKVNSVKSFGATVILHGDAYDEAYAHAKEFGKEHNLTFIHPYDDPMVIAGQGTIGKELLEQLETIDYVFIPVGGGGLAAGICAYMKEKAPHIKIIAVEPEDAACLSIAMRDGKRTTLNQVGIFVDGVAVKQIGEEPFKILQPLIDDTITASTDEVCAAIKDIFEDTRTIAEPAGALGLAGLKQYVSNHHLEDKNLITIISGANVNFDRLRHIAERAELGEEKEALFAVKIPEKPGSFRQFCKSLGPRSVTEFNYRKANEKNAYIFLGIGLQSGVEEKSTIESDLKTNKFEFHDLTNNEAAKLHMRHMVGGKASVPNEKLFRFQFPERPGALMQFLNHMEFDWNITLFHYRNHGSAFGRILVGIQIPEGDEENLTRFLESLNFFYVDETNNTAFSFFL